MLTADQVEALDAHVTTEQAAERVRRTPATIRSWSGRGYLTPINADSLGRKYYKLVDVLRCDRDRRNAMLPGHVKQPA